MSTTSAKRRPGRPRKRPTTPSLPSKNPAVEHPPDSDDEETSAPLEAAAGSEDGPPDQGDDASTDSAADKPPSASAVGSRKSPVKSEHRSIVSTRRRTSAGVPPLAKIKAKKLLPMKRGRGRPPRVIKKPRKYLDSYDEEILKPDPGSVGEDPNEDDSEEEEDEEEEAGDDKDLLQVLDDAVQSVVGQKTGCPKCGKKFTTASNCHRHIVKDQCSHSYQCGFCEKLFRSV